ncbi:hypothetical protein SAMN06295905_2536 [Devosia lucknowensis]|uniref:Uncharacterized protein n=1 Tax=Devosia lucknowensis TaxID=1096929 RepID=A0A1Y6GAZ2_9HYPH|nr:hypothetical protein [Devosia lucknowensis]SMQ85259.1 hypothetical protein SAMN06295905_2536 [Devosia lucknowensis]
MIPIQILIVAVGCVFGVFAAAVGFAQVKTRGMVAPGALKVD